MRTAKYGRLEARVLVLAITFALVLFAIRRQPVHELTSHLRSVRISWFLSALILYGFLFIPAGCRWHLALRLANSEIDLATSIRLSLIGHFFYTIFFGAVGGDAAKSTLYARWYGLPLPNILAASSLDRLLGFGGLVLFAMFAFVTAALHHIPVLGLLSARIREWWIFLCVPLLIVLVLLFWYASPGSSLRRYANQFAASARSLIASPKSLSWGLLCGLLVQLALSGVLALNLQAVNHTSLPWLRLLWTFPVITAVSALPVTVAGLGVRENAAVVLLGLCQISGVDAVAASLLTAAASLFWMVAGGIWFWREMLQRQDGHGSTGLIPAEPR